MVGRSCCVTECRSDDDGPGYFQFPNFKKLNKRKQWVELLGLSPYYLNEQIKKRFFVCFRHFKKQDIVISGKYLKLTKGTLKVMLVVEFTSQEIINR